VRSRRLLLLTPDFPPATGGIQRLLSEFCTYFTRRGWRISVVAPALWPDDTPHPDTPFALRRTRARWSPRTRFAVLAEMMSVAARTPADIVLAGHVATLPPAAVATARRRPLAAMAYGSELWSPRGARIARLLHRRVGRFIAISNFTKREVERLGIEAERIGVATPGAAIPDPPEDWQQRLAHLGLASHRGRIDPFLLTIARLSDPHKGQDIVIRSMGALVSRYPGLKYVIAGQGDLRDHLERIAAVTGVADAVRFVGGVDEPTKRSLLAGCRALAMPSREARAAGQFEGFGIALVEAGLARRPVIAGNSGGMPEAVIHRETGLLINPLSTVEFADAASLLLDNAALADALGDGGRERALAEFTWERFGERMDRELSALS